LHCPPVALRSFCGVQNVRANHGGGYQYRICPLSEELSEECFQKHPLPFAGAVALEWQNGSRLEIQGRFLSNGTVPAGSAWARQPMPYSNANTPPQFDPPCDEKPDAWKTETGVCSGRYLTNVSIVDWLTVPRATPSGDYVLQLRYDCEVGRAAPAHPLSLYLLTLTVL
jgi:lytic starch monooxygenase